MTNSGIGTAARVEGGSGRAADVFNPATGEVQARVALASKAEVDAAVAARRRRRSRAGARPIRSGAAG